MTLWRSSGRASEPSDLSYNTLKWNLLFGTPTMKSPQSKPSKVKHVLFPAGIKRHADWMLAFGDNMVFKSRELSSMNMAFTADQPKLLLPKLDGDNAGDWHPPPRTRPRPPLTLTLTLTTL